MLEMTFADETQGRVAKLVGRLDTKTVQDFESAGLAWIEGGCRRIALDLSELDYISSAGLRSILLLAKRLLPLGGKIVLFGMGGVVEEVFSISGFDRFLPVAPSRGDALTLLA